MRTILNIKVLILTGLCIAFGVLYLLFFAPLVRAGNISKEQPAPRDLYRTYEFFASTTAPTTVATTTNATSTNVTAILDSSGIYDNGAFVISGAKEVVLYFGRGDTTGQGNVGTSTFRIQVSEDGTNWNEYPRLIPLNAGVTSNAFQTTATSSTILAATSTRLFKMAEQAFFSIRCIVQESTDGEHRCAASARW